MAFNLDLVTPDKKVYSGKATKLIIPSINGQLTILSHHTPLFTMLAEGMVAYTDENNRLHELAIGRGMIEIKNDLVSLLVESSEHTAEAAKRQAQLAQDKADNIDKSKITPRGKISPEDAYRRSILDVKDIKIKKKPKIFNPSEISSIK